MISFSAPRSKPFLLRSLVFFSRPSLYLRREMGKVLGGYIIFRSFWIYVIPNNVLWIFC